MANIKTLYVSNVHLLGFPNHGPPQLQLLSILTTSAMSSEKQVPHSRGPSFFLRGMRAARSPNPAYGGSLGQHGQLLTVADVSMDNQKETEDLCAQGWRARPLNAQES